MGNQDNHSAGEGQATPTALRTIEELINTRSLVFDTERLSGPTELARWLSARELLAPGVHVGDAELDRTIQLREGLRTLLIRHNRGAADESDQEDETSALKNVEPLTRELSLYLDMSAEPPGLRPSGGGFDAALAAIVGGIPAAVANETWHRLKVCRKIGCRFAYYDHSRNRARAWCSMETCGNQAKVRAFRQRATRR